LIFFNEKAPRISPALNPVSLSWGYNTLNFSPTLHFLIYLHGSSSISLRLVLLSYNGKLISHFSLLFLSIPLLSNLHQPLCAAQIAKEFLTPKHQVCYFHSVFLMRCDLPSSLSWLIYLRKQHQPEGCMH